MEKEGDDAEEVTPATREGNDRKRRKGRRKEEKEEKEGEEERKRRGRGEEGEKGGRNVLVLLIIKVLRRSNITRAQSTEIGNIYIYIYIYIPPLNGGGVNMGSLACLSLISLKLVMSPVSVVWTSPSFSK